MKLTIDFETRSQVDIRTKGAYNYAVHPSTEVLCLAIKVDNEEPKIYIPRKFRGIVDTELSRDEVEELIKKAETIEAHNAHFELLIWHHVMPRYGFDPIDVNKVFCSLAKASMCSLPRSLKGGCDAIGMEEGKDNDGHAIMMAMCKPRQPTQKERVGDWRDKIY